MQDNQVVVILGQIQESILSQSQKLESQSQKLNKIQEQLERIEQNTITIMWSLGTDTTCSDFNGIQPSTKSQIEKMSNVIEAIKTKEVIHELGGLDEKFPRTSLGHWVSNVISKTFGVNFKG